MFLKLNIRLTKTRAAQNEVALRYHTVRALHFLVVVLRRLYYTYYSLLRIAYLHF